VKRSGKQGNNAESVATINSALVQSSRRQGAKRATDLEIPGESFEPEEVRVKEAKQGDVGKRHQNNPKRAGRKSKEQKRGEKEKQ